MSERRRALVKAATPFLLYGLTGIAAAFELVVLWLALHPSVNADYRAFYLDQTTTCMNEPVRGTYHLGAVISFLPGHYDEALQVKVCGWEGPVGDGNHSVGEMSRLRFTFPETAENLVLRLTLTAIPTAASLTQRVVLSANGVGFGQVAIPAQQTQSFEVPVPAAALGRDGHQLDLTLAFPDAIRPEANDSNTRKRAIKIVSAQLIKAAASGADPADKSP